jgi:hypothetical protein
MNVEDGASQPYVAYDSLFASNDADFVLRASDGMQYRIHTFTLRTASAFFRTMLTLPQPSNVTDFLTLDEPSKVVGPLLMMISGMEMPQWGSYDEIENVLEAAHKYDVPGPVATIRYILASPRFLSEPVRLYAIATRYDWHDEAILAAEESLKLSIHDTKYAPFLEQIPSRPLLKLLDLHRNRRDGFRYLINDPERFTTGNAELTHCDCGLPVDNSSWLILKSALILEMDKRPLGDTLLGTILEEWPESTACWEAQCKACSKSLYAREITLRGIKDCLDSLPSSI